MTPADPGAALQSYADVVPVQIEPLPGGLIHQSYSVLCRSGARYVLQRVRPIFRREIHENIRAVVAELRRAGMLTPELIATRSGTWLADLGSQGLWRLWTWIEGATFARCSSPEQAQSAAQLVARFHAVLAELPHELHPLGIPFHDTEAHLQELRDAVRAHAGHRLSDAVRPLASEIFTCAEALPRWSALPRRVAHGDLKFNNVRFAGSGAELRDRAICLVDLDTLSRLPLWAELGDAWRSWCNRRDEDDAEAELDEKLLETSLGAYLAATELRLQPEERDSLAYALEWISLELAARFAGDALRECYFGWNPQRFSGAGEHNLVRARGQLSLHHQARGARALQQRLLRG